MRITKEADYALRIAYLLARNGGVLDAGTISQSSGVTDRFTVKILRKLILGGIVSSKKGAYGGYELAVPPEDVSMKRIIELIDGPMAISCCLDAEYECTRIGDQKNLCTFHIIFSKINSNIARMLDSITFDAVISEDINIQEILSKI